MAHILIVGQNISNFTEYLNTHGHTYTFLQDKVKVTPKAHLDDGRVIADFSSNEALFETVDQLDQKPDAVIAIYENYVLYAALIAEHLGLPGLPLESAYACTDKFLMRSLFATAPEKISPDFAIVESEADLQAFADSHSFPLILKPANLAKSLLVTKNSSLPELLENYHKSVELIQEVYHKYAPNRKPKLIIEEFLEGSIHSVDAYVNQEGTPSVLEQVVDYQTGYDIGFDDNFHYSRILPSKLSLENQAALRHAAEIGIKALGMRSSPAHVEIILTKEGPRIVEIGARNGGYRNRMHWLANGIDITGNAIRVALGLEPEVKATKNEPCAVLELFPKTPGIITGITNEDILKELPSLTYYSRKKEDGEYTGKAADGYKTAAIVILHNPDVTQFDDDLSFVNSSVSVETKEA